MEIYFFSVMVVIMILIALRSMFTAQQLMNPPQYRLLNPEESNSIKVEQFEWYQTEAEGQDFSLLGDFQHTMGAL
jgi:lipoprotein signal peptidase